MKTVFVGLSGGVDSAVSAYVLQQAGYRVVGVFLKVWEPDFLPCTSAQDRLSAMRVAAHLRIPFISYDLAEEYKNGVVDYFVAEYKAGRTPNPDVMCNRAIKFGSFWERAKYDGADMIATGHYAQNRRIETPQGTDRFGLYRGADSKKDQSYFLWMLNQDDLSHSLFPIGHLEKKTVRAIAQKAGLPNFAKKDSQGLCFLGHVDMEEFLRHYITPQKGAIVTTAGEHIGVHSGASFYTIGQRIPLSENASPHAGKKMYVIGKNIATNELVVAPEYHHENLPYAQSIVPLRDVRWIRAAPDPDKKYCAELRYHGSCHRVTIQVNSVQFEHPVLIAPGQSLVVYDFETNECLGGGIMSTYAHDSER
jgi:tRNA-uridine 2-sulfurtransferase